MICNVIIFDVCAKLCIKGHCVLINSRCDYKYRDTLRAVVDLYSGMKAPYCILYDIMCTPCYVYTNLKLSSEIRLHMTNLYKM